MKAKSEIGRILNDEPIGVGVAIGIGIVSIP